MKKVVLGVVIFLIALISCNKRHGRTIAPTIDNDNTTIVSSISENELLSKLEIETSKYTGGKTEKDVLLAMAPARWNWTLIYADIKGAGAIGASGAVIGLSTGGPGGAVVGAVIGGILGGVAGSLAAVTNPNNVGIKTVFGGVIKIQIIHMNM